MTDAHVAAAILVVAFILSAACIWHAATHAEEGQL